MGHSLRAARYASLLQSSRPIQRTFRGLSTSSDSAPADGRRPSSAGEFRPRERDLPPVSRPRPAGATTKGKLLTTPSRLLKLIIPLTTTDRNSDTEAARPLALLVHPQQPLSYLERLIQSELPTIKTNEGQEKIPAVHFKAQEFAQDEIGPRGEPDEETADEGDPEGASTNGTPERTGKVTQGSDHVDSAGLRGSSSSSTEGQGLRFVQWSTSTDIGDFIRDTARGKGFVVVIEGAAEEIGVSVPSFSDRTHYLRSRLRKTSRKISDMAAIKNECHVAAHKSAQRVALAGFGLLGGWWGMVYYLTFETSLGWDVMEPVTYLAGLSTLMGGYLWFLYHNREVSYRSALNITVSRRQNRLYEIKGFDPRRWEQLVEEGNALRKEIKKVANEYDVDWDERRDEHDESVTKALKKDREARKEKQQDEDGEDDGEDDDDDGDKRDKT